MARRASTAEARRASSPAPAEPPPQATVPLTLVVRQMVFCVCGFSHLAHAGPRGDGPCLVPGSDCRGYREAPHADP